MNKILGNYSNPGGGSSSFPMDVETLEYIQENNRLTEIIGNIAGDKVILSGMINDSGSHYTEGYVFLCTNDNPTGEVLHWGGGQIMSNLYISSTNINVSAQGTLYSSAYTKRELTTNSGGSTGEVFNIKDFTYASENLPMYGEIKIFAGPLDKIPSNWCLCDGRALEREAYPKLYAVIGNTYNNSDPAWDMNTDGSVSVTHYTYSGSTHFRIPDLRSRFIVCCNNGTSTVGTSTNRATQRNIGDVGGTKSVKLTSAESGMRDHNHTITASTNWTGDHYHGTWGEAYDNPPYGVYDWNKHMGSEGGRDYDDYTYKTSTNGGHSHTVTASCGQSGTWGASNAHENMPPFYTLAYIIRIK